MCCFTCCLHVALNVHEHSLLYVYIYMQHMDAAARHLLVEQEQVKGSLQPTFDRVIRIGKEFSMVVPESRNVKSLSISRFLIKSCITNICWRDWFDLLLS